MFGEMAQMLLDKGLAYEARVPAGYEGKRTVHPYQGGNGRDIRGVGGAGVWGPRRGTTCCTSCL